MRRSLICALVSVCDCVSATGDGKKIKKKKEIKWKSQWSDEKRRKKKLNYVRRSDARVKTFHTIFRLVPQRTCTLDPITWSRFRAGELFTQMRADTTTQYKFQKHEKWHELPSTTLASTRDASNHSVHSFTSSPSHSLAKWWMVVTVRLCVAPRKRRTRRYIFNIIARLSRIFGQRWNFRRQIYF